MPATAVTPSMTATVPRPISMSSWAAWMFALRISQRVPTTSVS